MLQQEHQQLNKVDEFGNEDETANNEALACLKLQNANLAKTINDLEKTIADRDQKIYDQSLVNAKIRREGIGPIHDGTASAAAQAFEEEAKSDEDDMPLMNP